MPKIGVILSGCGVQDGTEIHEAVLTLLALDRAGAEVVMMAPDKEQVDVVNHLDNEVMKERRNVLVESARIARGEIVDIAQVKSDELDAVILPGGFGAAKNLSDFATRTTEELTVDPGVRKLLEEMYASHKPIAALCIAPAVLAGLFGETVHPDITIGNDADTAAALEAMGAKHHDVEATEVIVDVTHRFVTTPCYMTATRITDVAIGAEKAVYALLAMVETAQRS